MALGLLYVDLSSESTCLLLQISEKQRTGFTVGSIVRSRALRCLGCTDGVTETVTDLFSGTEELGGGRNGTGDEVGGPVGA